jgi:hypothetical protein
MAKPGKAKKGSKRGKTEKGWDGKLRSWGYDPDMKEAKKIFFDTLAADTTGERQNCLDSGPHARTMFAAWGGFYIDGEKPADGLPPYDPGLRKKKMPAETVFRVWRSGKKDKDDRNKEVVLIVDEDDEPYKDEDIQYWRCTYTPYSTKPKPKKRKKH